MFIIWHYLYVIYVLAENYFVQFSDNSLNENFLSCPPSSWSTTFLNCNQTWHHANRYELLGTSWIN